MSTKKPTGRPPAGKRTRRAQLVIRCDSSDYAAWKREAARLSMSLAEYVRRMLNAAARKTHD